MMLQDWLSTTLLIALVFALILCLGLLAAQSSPLPQGPLHYAG